MTLYEEKQVLEEVLNFKIKEIPDTIRFWMIRTKGGYFYNEFLTKKFVALAWNNITKDVSLSDTNKDAVIDDILLQFENIKRPTTVFNKCKTFIEDIKPGDVLIIPNKGSSHITFAFAGEYYEEEGKSVALEKTVIDKIENGYIQTSDVSCPYKKRRHIELITTVRAERLNIHLYKSISNYHGLSNFDNYAFQILDQLYTCYAYMNNVRIVFHVSKPDPIGPRELSRMLYGTIDCLAMITDEHKISTQLALQSEGDIVFFLQNAFNLLVESKTLLIGLVVLIGGGNFLSVQLPGVPKIIENILSIKPDVELKTEEIKKARLENESLAIDNLNKKYELMEKLKKEGVDIPTLLADFDQIAKSQQTMQIRPPENEVLIPSDVTDSEVPEDDEQ